MTRHQVVVAGDLRRVTAHVRTGSDQGGGVPEFWHRPGDEGLHGVAKEPLGEIETGDVQRALLLPGEKITDLPVMTEGIDDPAEAPAVRFLDREHLPGAGLDRLREHRVRVRHRQN